MTDDLISRKAALNIVARALSPIISLYQLIEADINALPAANTSAQCCMCGKTGLSTVEGDGCTECELSDGRWVCSSDCWDKADPLTPTRVADSGGRATDSTPMKEVE